MVICMAKLIDVGDVCAHRSNLWREALIKEVNGNRVMRVFADVQIEMHRLSKNEFAVQKSNAIVNRLSKTTWAAVI